MGRISPKRDITGESPLATLTPKAKQFALFVSEGKPVRTAARLAGYASDAHTPIRLMRMPKMQVAVAHLQKQYEKSIVASRKQVLEGFLEAIEQAKLLADPGVQIAGWREIGKMCGYYAPEVKEVNITVGAKRVIGQLEVLSDAELLELIEKDREAIEGEALLLSDGVDQEQHSGEAFKEEENLDG
jgi:hypothetical protein